MGICDMLPGELLVMPATKCCTNEMMGLYKKICHHCGTEFEATQQHKYRMQINGKDCWFCRYNCFRPYEKAEAETYRNIRLGFTRKIKPDEDKTLEQRAREHLAYCKRKLAKWQGKRNDPDYWKTLTLNQKKSINNQMRWWKEKVECAEVTLKAVTENENT